MHELDTETAQRIDRCAEMSERVKSIIDVADDYFHRHLLGIILDNGDDAQVRAAFNLSTMLATCRDLAADAESESRDIIIDAGERRKRAALSINPTIM